MLLLKREVDDVERDRQLIITIMYSLFPAPQKTTCALRTEDDDDGEDDDRQIGRYMDMM